LLRPTIRAERSELWASWNPRRRSDAIDDFFRTRKPEGAVVTKANWRDNPWFPAVLEEGRRLDLAHCPERYEHVWEGDYARAFEGAYFAQTLAEARAQGRIGKVSADPLLPLRLHRYRRLRRASRRFHDLGRPVGRRGNQDFGLLRGRRPGAGVSRQLVAQPCLRQRDPLSAARRHQRQQHHRQAL
jgi:hypothetical protein